MIQFCDLQKKFFVRDNIAEVESVTVHVKLQTISDTSGIHRGGVKCASGQKMEKMTSVTGQDNNRVVYTNNKTVTLFSFHTFIFDFFVLLKKKITVQI